MLLIHEHSMTMHYLQKVGRRNVLHLKFTLLIVGKTRSTCNVLTRCCRRTLHSSHSMWSISRMARYVQRCKYLQQLKENDDAYHQSVEKGSFLLFCKNKPLLAKKKDGKPFQNVLNWRSFQETENVNPKVRTSSIVLDVDEEKMTPLFVCSVAPEVEQDVQTKYDGRFTDMRAALFSLSDDDHQLITRGFSMITWDEKFNFCSYCGSPLDRKPSGCVKVCRKKCNEAKMTHYPQVYPVAITRVINHTQDKILLVRKAMFPPGMYSCIAGFMEPGEVLEDNVRREIAEEAGIVVDNIQYFQSEAWPLPQPSLMMACTAVAMPGSVEIDLDKEELEDGKWFTKEEVIKAIARVKKNPNLMDNLSEELLIPPRGAIANLLIRNWVEQYNPSRL